MASTLTKEQLLLLNDLMYAKDNPTSIDINSEAGAKLQTVGEYVTALQENPSALGGGKAPYFTDKDWQQVLGAIQNDSQLSNMQIVSRHTDTQGGGGQSVFLSDPSTNEAVVVFKGTEDEWKDNFQGAYQPDTAYQKNAKAWFDSLDLDGYDNVTVTGHSKGGNKAMYIAVTSDEVDNCVSFDGQGFPDEFIEKYKDRIAARQGLIENHCAEKDYVNLLLNQIGTAHFYQSNGETNFLYNHSPDTMMTFDANGNPVMTECDRPQSIAELDKFLNSYLRSMPADMKASSSEFLGDLAATCLRKDHTKQDIFDILLAPGNEKEAAYLLGYLMRYEKSVGLSDDVVRLLGGNDGLAVITRFLLDKIGGEAALVGLGLMHVIPREALEKMLGVTLTEAQYKRLMTIADQTCLEYLSIRVNPNSGEDLKVDAVEKNPVLGGLTSAAGDIIRLLAAGPGMIFAQPAQLMLAASKMLAAIRQYRDAVNKARSAAEELSGKWQGDARDAFVQEQSRSYTWQVSLGNVFSGITEAVSSAARRYADCEDKIQSIIRNF